MIVAIEGLDASGKATQSKLLAEKLGGTRFSFPNYESPTGELIRGHLEKKWGVKCVSWPRDRHVGHEEQRLDATVFQSLQTVNRIESLPAICEAMYRGPVVVDRYWASAVVYGVLDGLDRDWLMATQAAPMPKAAVWILLDTPVEESFKRRPKRRDRYEVDHPYLERVRGEYLRLFNEQRNTMRMSMPDGHSWLQEWHVVDGLGTVEQVHERVMKIMRTEWIEWR
jgi:dTMP kinase